MATERWGALPLGETHPKDACAFCGDTAYFRAKKVTRLVTTGDYAVICKDVAACERRRYNRRRGIA